LQENERLIEASMIGQSALALSSIHRTPEYGLRAQLRDRHQRRHLSRDCHMLWAMLMITSTINQAAQIPMMMSQTMSQVAGIMRWASELAARFSFELDPGGRPTSCATPPASVNRRSRLGLPRRVNRAMIQDTNR
jgi:hypothetical protein